MNYIYNDGGRSKYFKGEAGDCVCRAIAIATGKDYKEVYDELNKLSKDERTGKRKRKVSSARNGVYKNTEKKYLTSLGWTYHSTCGIGKGVSMHLTDDEIPVGTIICQISKHLVCVIDKVINDTWNSSEKEYYDENGDLCVNSKRAVYGYWTKEI